MTQQKTRKPAKPVAITPRYEEILEAVHECRYVTISHITRLFYASTSQSHVNEIMLKLAGGKDYAQGHYLYRFPLPNIRIGNTERVYTLGGKGIRYLQEERGLEIPWRFDSSKIQSLAYNYLMHQLDITSFLIAAKLFSRENEQKGVDPVLEEYKTEYVLRPLREKVTISVKTADGSMQEESVPVVPDLWLDFHFPVTKQKHMPVLIEIDRGTEGLKKFKQNLKARIVFIDGDGYRKMFGMRAVTIAYVVTAGHPNRLDEIRIWTDEVLKELNKKNYADTFRFCRLSPSWEAEYHRLFSDPLWLSPGDKRPIMLLA